MIRLISLALAMLCLAVPASADTRDVYTIKDIPVDERAANVLEAQRKAFATARIIGARRLINRITLAEDRERAGGLSVDAATAQRMAVAVDVQEESRGGGRYRGVLSAVINPREVRPYLDQRGVPYIDRQAPLALLIPIAPDSAAVEWREAWGEAQKATLAPTVTAYGNYTASSTWGDIEAELRRANAARGIIAELRPGGSVRLTQVTASGNSAIGTTGGASDFDASVRRSLLTLEDTWKKQSIVRNTGVRTLAEANILYTSLPEWNRLRGALARSPLVSEFQIRAVSTNGAMVRFAYSGDQAQLERDLRQRGLNTERGSRGWTMRSATARVPDEELTGPDE